MIPDGIWLGLSPELYHADPALGSHSLADILTNPVQWYARERNETWRALNPPPEKETLATRFGQALHTMILEPDQFWSRYFVMPERPPLPKTKEEINAILLEMGYQALKTAQKTTEYEAAAAQAGIKTVAAWTEEQVIASAGLEIIPDAWGRSLELLRTVLDGHSVARKFLSNGRAEVSVFWTDASGLRMKCRFDYLRTRTVSDLKSYAYRKGDEPVSSFVSTCERFGYDFQAACYMDCRLTAMPPLIEANRVYVALDIDPETGELDATVPSLDTWEFFQKLARETEPTWAWIACMTQGYPEVDAIELPSHLLQFSSAMVQVEQARETARQMLAKFKPGEPWIIDRGLVRLNDHCFKSNRARDRGAVMWEQG